MKKTLYYNVIIKEKFQDYQMHNDGFIIVNLDGERLLGIEGVVTCDYIKAEMREDNLFMVYYSFDCETQMMVEDFETIIPKENIELPFNIKFMKGSDVVKITTEERITNHETKKKYEEILKKFKKNSVFQEER